MESKSPDDTLFQDKEFSENLFNQLMDLYIKPEITKRQTRGELNESFDLWAAQIILLDDKEPQVRLNREIIGIVKVKLKSGVMKKSGELILQSEVEGIEEVKLPEGYEDYGHATLMRIGTIWTIIFDFRYNKGLSREHIKVAEEFLKCAEHSFENKYWHSFIDNLFSASELLVKSLLLSIPLPELKKKTTHSYLHSEYNRFRVFGDMKIEFKKTFNRLSLLRHPARYLKGRFSIGEDEALFYLDKTRSMIGEFKKMIEN